MRWSVSKSKIFSRCQRKWYYYELVAHARANDDVRREAYFLKQLQSISAWRGSLVDTVIHNFITPRLLSHTLPNENETLEYALNLKKSQISFGKERKHRNPALTKSNSGISYCAFYDLEYDGELKEGCLQNAEREIVSALKNLLSSELLKNIAETNQYVISQRSLSFSPFEDVRVVCVPDMVVFFEDKAPLIIDWKVHFFGNSDAWLQLGIYSIALSQVTPHKDFPASFSELKGNASQIDLVEFQLLKNIQRKYSITEQDVLDIEDYILRSIIQMRNLVNGRSFNELDVNSFQTARNPQTCSRCQFKKLCWLEDENRKPEHMQQTLFEVL